METEAQSRQSYFLNRVALNPNNYSLYLFLILLLGLTLRVYLSSDGFLHQWDERYHALVAKNLLNHPLKPTLYENAVLPYNIDDWVANHVWLEKPPIPFWCVALSLKVFGISEIAVRIPSILLSTIAIYLTFLLGKFLFNKRVGLLAAFLHSVNGLLIEVAGGRVSSDLVETFFIFFVELAMVVSVYSIYKKKSYMLSIVIGFLAGCSMLCKWNPGLIVIPVWLFGAYFSKQYSFKQLFLNAVIIVLACFIVYITWIIYILSQFPLEAEFVLKKFVFAYNKTLEGHEGPMYYYLDQIRIIFGELIYIPLIFNIYFLLRKKIRWQLILITAWWFIPLIIFSLAATKRQTYLLITAPAFFIIIAYCWFYIKHIRFSVKYKFIINIILALLILLPVRFCIERMKPFETIDREPAWAAKLKNIKEIIPVSKNVIIFNMERPIETMFYNDCIAYSIIPDNQTINDLRIKGFTIVINENSKLDKSQFKNNSGIIIKELTK